jgi:hypothetical protein
MAWMTGTPIRMERVDGWAARTDRPLGPIPFVLGALLSAVLANAFTYTALQVFAWMAFAVFAIVLAARAVRWFMRQMEAVQIERETEQMLEREPRLTPMYHPPRWDEREYHKAS